LLLAHQAVDGDRPRAGLEIPGEAGGLVLVSGELVIVVVVADVFQRRDLFNRRERALLNAGNRVAGLDYSSRRNQIPQSGSAFLINMKTHPSISVRATTPDWIYPALVLDKTPTVGKSCTGCRRIALRP
jgi:hypothetical protein